MLNVRVPDLSVPFIVKLVALNHSIAAIPMKLRALGVPGMSASFALTFSWLYTLAVVGVTIAAARSTSVPRTKSAQLWLALLYLTSLRSPFMPDAYAPLAVLWLITLFAAEETFAPKRLTWLFPMWLALCIVAPLGKEAPDPGLTTRLVAGLLSQLLGIGLAVFIVWRNLRASRTAATSGPGESPKWEETRLELAGSSQNE